MPRYDYRCLTCDDVFELQRPMSDVGVAAPCPAGHPDTVKLISVFARTGVAAGTDRPAGGGCCGGGCGCGH